VGRDLDFERSYVVPPLAPGAALRLEADQIEEMGLRPIVSVTDHDTIAAARSLLTIMRPDDAPISLEWTVPFGDAVFHVGVHNLPADLAGEIVEALLDVPCAYCQAHGVTGFGHHDARCLPHVMDWMDRLSSFPQVLVVLNHPLWDTCGLGELEYRRVLTAFLARYKNTIHALELNGLRDWFENCEVIELAEERGLPLVSGGDRLGREPSAVLNLTSAEGFSEFAHEIRSGKPSEIVFMQQYQQPLLYRKLRAAWEIMRSHPSAPGKPRWSDRIFLPWRDGRALPLSASEWTHAFVASPSEAPEQPECVTNTR
jgi:hypothetical protein